MSNEQHKSDCAAYFDRGAPSYGTVMPFFERSGRDLAAHGRHQPGDRLLDVGCGRGAALIPAAEAIGPTGQLIGIDLAPTMVRLSGQRVADLGLSSYVEVRVGDAENPDFPADSFDVVQASLVLFFLPDLGLALRRYAELLRSGGRLVASTYVSSDRPRWRPVYEALEELLPGGPPEPTPVQRDPAGWSDALVEQLGAVGYADLELVERRYDIGFDDHEHWWAWAESGGFRTLLEQIPADQLPAAKRAMFDAVDAAGDSLRGQDGRLTWSPVLRHIRAVRP